MTPDLYSRFRFAEKPRLVQGIGLALDGGFARGCAHLGVLRVFEEQNIPVSCIAGTGIGAAIGAAYASGTPLGRLIGKCREFQLRDLLRWRASRFGLASSKRLEQLLRRTFDAAQLEQLKIPMAIVATDLDTGDPVVFKQGSVTEAVRASCAFPGLFEPVQIGTRFLADGSLAAPLPTRAARELGAQVVIGVSTGLHDRRPGTRSHIFHLVRRAISAAQKHHLDASELYADLVLRPSVHDIAWDEFNRVDEAIEAGANVARRALPQIRKMLDVLAEHTPVSGQQGEYLIAESLR